MYIGKVMGVPLLINISLILALPLYALVFGVAFFDVSGFPIGLGRSTYDLYGKMILGAFLAIFLFFAILLHELGHVWAAKHKGYQVTSVTLFFAGGVSEMDHTKDWPRGEAEVAITGALLSIVVGLALLSIYYLVRGGLAGWAETFAAIVLSGFGLLNLFLGVMNALPILPMDGGLVLRDLLRYDLGLARASEVTIFISRAVALLMVAVGIFLLNWVIILAGVVLLLTIDPRQLGR